MHLLDARKLLVAGLQSAMKERMQLYSQIESLTISTALYERNIFKYISWLNGTIFSYADHDNLKKWSRPI
jgi:hypothetical protein